MTMKKPKHVKPQGGEGVAEPNKQNNNFFYAILAIATIVILSIIYDKFAN